MQVGPQAQLPSETSTSLRWEVFWAVLIPFVVTFASALLSAFFHVRTAPLLALDIVSLAYWSWRFWKHNPGVAITATVAGFCLAVGASWLLPHSSEISSSKMMSVIALGLFTLGMTFFGVKRVEYWEERRRESDRQWAKKETPLQMQERVKNLPKEEQEIEAQKYIRESTGEVHSILASSKATQRKLMWRVGLALLAAVALVLMDRLH